MEIAAWLLDQDQAATWITERELLRDQLKGGRDLDGRLLRGPGRRPDGVLVRANNRRDAVEVEVTPKRHRTEYDRKLALGAGVVRSAVHDGSGSVAQTGVRCQGCRGRSWG